MSRDEAKRFLTAEWRHLAMLNYEVDPALLAELVPRGTVLDFWAGRTFVSMVAFRFLDTRVLGVPIPFHRDFDEVNLRFYVRRRAADGEERRGVVFVSEIVPRRAIAWVARRFYNENYRALPMRHTHSLPTVDQEEGRVEHRWLHRGSWNRLSAGISGEPRLAPEDSEAAFITEHYWGYSAQTDGSTIEYQVEHPSWRVWAATRSELECDVKELYGGRFVETLSALPTSAFVAEGSPVIVRRGRRLVATGD